MRKEPDTAQDIMNFAITCTIRWPVDVLMVQVRSQAASSPQGLQPAHGPSVTHFYKPP